MAKTVLITGTSSGFGYLSAKKFAANGWNVVATMRCPQENLFAEYAGQIMVAELDVTKPDTIDSAIAAALERFGRIDAVVNNAGYGFGAIFEATPMADIRAIFETNVFGVIHVLQKIIPYFRKQGQGTIVNVSSSIGIVAAPRRAAYAATKFAVEGLSESLSYELESQNIRIRLVEPGFVVTTNFMTSPAAQHADKDIPIPESYQAYCEAFAKRVAAPPLGTTEGEEVAEQIYRAACDTTDKLRYPAGPDANQLIAIRWSENDEGYMAKMRQYLQPDDWR